MPDIAPILQENAKKINAALLAIEPELARISEEIKKINAEPSRVYFLDKDGNRLKEGSSEGKLTIPGNTAKIIANGNLDLKGDVKNIEIFAKISVTADTLDRDSQIIAGGDVNIKQVQLGKITAGGNFSTQGITHNEVVVKGSVLANASHADSQIIAGKYVNIIRTAQGQISTNGNFTTEGVVYGNVIAGGNVKANDTNLGTQIIAGGDVSITKSPMGEINAGGNLSTKGAIFGTAIAGGSITAKEIDANANIATPHLYIREGSRKPENFEGEVTVIPKNKWDKFTPPQPEQKPENPGPLSGLNIQELNDFRRNAGAECKDMGDSTPCPPAHSKPAPAKQR